MVQRVIEYAIAKEEKQFGTRLNYLREIARESKVAFLKLYLARSFNGRRNVLPKAAYHLAALVVAACEGEHDCRDLALHAALASHVPAHYLRATLDENYHLLPEPLERVCAFTRSIIEGVESTELRNALGATYGRRGLIELSFAIADSRMRNTVKRSLGIVEPAPMPTAAATAFQPA